MFGLVDGIPPSIARIFFLNPAGLHSSDKLGPADTLGRRTSVQLDSIATDGRLLLLAWGYAESTKGHAGLPVLISYDSLNIRNL